MGVMGLSFLGVIAALAMYAVSVSPSLMARSWTWHAVASGILVACGYIAGLVVQNVGLLVIRLTGLTIRASDPAEIGFRVAAAALFAIWWFYAVIQSYRRDRVAATLVNMPGETVGEYLLGTAGAVAVAWTLLMIVRAFNHLGRILITTLAGFMPRPAAFITGVAILFVIIFFLTSKVILRGGIGFFRRKAEQLNMRTARGIYKPTVPERSASPASPVTWESVGGQGRVFLGRGPSRRDIAQVCGVDAMEPIRVYSGMPTGGTGIEAAAATVVAELHRTGAFDRAVILIAASTGSGWVDEWQVQPLEFLTRGNCATASLQYSYVPSVLNWLTGLEPAQDASAALFTAVRAELDLMDEASRPALFVCGESLGAFASQSVFSSVEDALTQVDGALWVGTPAFTPMHEALTAARHTGSPEVAPVVNNGRRVRFVNEPSDLRTDLYGRELGPWGFPRIVYAQHPSDRSSGGTTSSSGRSPTGCASEPGATSRGTWSSRASPPTSRSSPTCPSPGPRPVGTGTPTMKNSSPCGARSSALIASSTRPQCTRAWLRWMVAGWTMRWLNVSALSCARTWSCPTDSKRAASLRLGTVDLEAWQGPVDLVDPAGLVVPSNQGGPHVGL